MEIRNLPPPPQPTVSPASLLESASRTARIGYWELPLTESAQPKLNPPLRSQHLRARLKEARRKLELTQAGAAKAWGVPLNTLICWENNRRHPATFTLARLNQLLDEILGMDPPAHGPGNHSASG